MPIDVSRSRDGENQKSDQTSTRRDASPKSGRIHDHVIYQYQLYEHHQQEAEWQREGKGPAPAGVKDRRPVDGDGKYRKKQIVLSKRYGNDNPGLKGGMDQGEGSSSSDLNKQERLEALDKQHKQESDNLYKKQCEEVDKAKRDKRDQGYWNRMLEKHNAEVSLMLQTHRAERASEEQWNE